MNLPKQIKKFREEKGLSQEDLAKKIYVSKQLVENWEGEISYPDLNNLLLLSVLFDASLDELLNGDLKTMKEKVNNKDVKNWAIIMIFFYFLSLIVGIPLIFIIGNLGWVIVVLSFAISFVAGLKVGDINRKLELNTYKKILDFVENGELTKDKSVRDYKSYWKDNLLKYVAGGTFGGLIGIVLVVLIKFFV